MRTRKRRTRSRLLALGAAVVTLSLVTAPGQAGATPRAGEPIPWVALGDSYTAGSIPYASSRPGGVQSDPPYFWDGFVGGGTRSGCDQTDVSYPYLVDDELGEFGEGRVELRANVSCGGAQIKHIVDERQTPYGQNVRGITGTNPFFPVDPDADPESQAFPQLDQVQLDAVDSTTRLVTVGIGGNSLGFGHIIAECLARGAATDNHGAPCRDYYTDPPSGVESIAHRLTRVAEEYRAMLAAIKARAHPEVKILAVGYPFIIPNDEDVSRCRWGRLDSAAGLAAVYHFGSVNHDDLKWLRDSVLERLNTVIEDAANSDPAVYYVDLYSQGQPGHHVCAQTGIGVDEAWVEGLIDQTAYVSLFTRFPRGALVHPNTKHHTAAAGAVGAKIREVFDLPELAAHRR